MTARNIPNVARARRVAIACARALTRSEKRGRANVLPPVAVARAVVDDAPAIATCYR
ncbi:MAG: hypothetical protein H6709_13750 [Kofleriaceae bacterium]|nr:hypothetical protein [Myxococcales bacterium]MCB9561975.1 hypothetical protein [Kofleriaceae bacterium]MCB9573143.1 hypothetical protein [Kofleriaceae bacterium]